MYKKIKNHDDYGYAAAFIIDIPKGRISVGLHYPYVDEDGPVEVGFDL